MVRPHRPARIANNYRVRGKPGDANVGVSLSDRELLPRETDWSQDLAYIDNAIVRVVRLYTNLFRLQYANKAFLDFDIDQVKAGGRICASHRQQGLVLEEQAERPHLPENLQQSDHSDDHLASREYSSQILEALARGLDAWIRRRNRRPRLPTPAGNQMPTAIVSALTTRNGQLLSTGRQLGLGEIRASGSTGPRPEATAGGGRGASVHGWNPALHP